MKLIKVCVYKIRMGALNWNPQFKVKVSKCMYCDFVTVKPGCYEDLPAAAAICHYFQLFLMNM